MTPERRKQLAKGLAKNDLLPELFDARADEIRDTWETTEQEQAETRETLFQELLALNNLRDFIYAKLADYAGDGDSD